ncbi:MAG: ABC transporter substrate-binding protein [Desulfobacterales bacterium]|nr:ABC transporter substrate-binding protein [Desulfobacterales bacterium]
MKRERGAGYKDFRSRYLFAVCIVFLFSTNLGADPGVSVSEVALGMSNALSGPAAALGTGVKKGAMVYFDKINASGGVHGRRIKVISYDDQYEPRITVANTEKLINKDKVFALFGYVGTPTSTAVTPLINKEKIIFFGPFTGAEFLRNPVNRYIFNVRSSYFDEAEAQVDYLTKKGIKKISMFLQNDAYGLAVKGGILKALKKRNMAIAGEGLYKRNTEDIDAGLAEIMKANPEAVSMVGTYKAMAAFIRKAKAEQFNPVFLNVSFVGTAALIKELGAAGDGIIVTQSVPSPHDTLLPIIEKYQSDMKAAGYNEFDFTDLEGYINALAFTEILQKAGQNLTRQAFINAAENLNINAGGLEFSYAPNDHQALKTVYMTRISGGKAVLMK